MSSVVTCSNCSSSFAAATHDNGVLRAKHQVRWIVHSPFGN